MSEKGWEGTKEWKRRQTGREKERERKAGGINVYNIYCTVTHTNTHTHSHQYSAKNIERFKSLLSLLCCCCYSTKWTPFFGSIHTSRVCSTNSSHTIISFLNLDREARANNTTNEHGKFNFIRSYLNLQTFIGLENIVSAYVRTSSHACACTIDSFRNLQWLGKK